MPEDAVTDQLAADTLIRFAVGAPELRLRLVWRADREGYPAVSGGFSPRLACVLMSPSQHRPMEVGEARRRQSPNASCRAVDR
jgi:hypothetical protein